MDKDSTITSESLVEKANRGEWPNSPHEKILFQHEVFKHPGNSMDCAECIKARDEWCKEYWQREFGIELK